MKCQYRLGECDNEATQVCDVPVIGESMCFCDTHVGVCLNEEGWYPLTPERAEQEEQSRIWLAEAIGMMEASFAKRRAAKEGSGQ